MRLTLRDAEFRHRTSWKQLTHVVGVPELVMTPLTVVVDGDIPEQDFDTSFQELLAGSPQLRAAEARQTYFHNSPAYI